MFCLVYFLWGIVKLLPLFSDHVQHQQRKPSYVNLFYFATFYFTNYKFVENV